MEAHSGGVLTDSRGRSVTEEPRKSMSLKISRLSGEIPVDEKLDIIFFGVKAISIALLPSDAILYIDRFFPGFDIIHELHFEL